MCRWLAYSGAPVRLEGLLYKPAHSLIDQSLQARLGPSTTNGDGFGIGWYDGASQEPALFRTTEPAWNDRNARELASHVSSPLVFAHVRASTGTPVQQTNCHPFRCGRHLWMHNGAIRGFEKVKRTLMFAVAPELFPHIQGSTDSETLFFLALTFGLDADPQRAVARAVGLVEAVGRQHGIEHPVQMTVATTDGEALWVFRYSSEHESRSLFFSTTVEGLRRLYPEVPLFQRLDAHARLVVSEPLGDLPGAWHELPESSCGLVHAGHDALFPFEPVAFEPEELSGIAPP